MYLEIDEDFATHPKTLRLSARLMNPTAGFYMLRLWSWARKFQKDGDLTAYDPAEIELAVGWTLGDGKFFASAVIAGFIDETRVGDVVTRRVLHNWMKRTGGAILRMEGEAERKKLWRAHSAKPKRCGGVASCDLCRAVPRSGDDEADMSAGRPVDGDETGTNTSEDVRVDKARQGKSKQDLDPSPLFPVSQPPDAHIRSEIRAEERNVPPGAGVWRGPQWYRRFEIAWAAKYGVLKMAGSHQGTMATRDLSEALEALPDADRRAAERRAENMISAYLALDKPGIVERRHPWAWFVTEFDGLRVSAAKARSESGGGTGYREIA